MEVEGLIRVVRSTEDSEILGARLRTMLEKNEVVMKLMWMNGFQFNGIQK